MKSLLLMSGVGPGTPLTKKEIIATAQKEADEIIETADTDLLRLVVAAARVAEYVGAFTTRLRPGALVDLYKGEVPRTINGAKLEARETGTKYDYSGDPVWRQLNATLAECQQYIKDREAFLKALKKPITEVDDDGEIITVNPPVKTSTTSLVITL